MFMVKQHNSFLIYALLSRIKLCRDYALFGGHFWQKFDGRGHENILKDRGLGRLVLSMFGSCRDFHASRRTHLRALLPM
jgi:hypothetical protein